MYFVTYQPSSQDGRVVHAVNTVNTTDSRAVIDDLDPTTEYTFTVDVGTAWGKLRGTLGAGQCMLLECVNYIWTYVMNAFIIVHVGLLEMLMRLVPVA